MHALWCTQAVRLASQAEVACLSAACNCAIMLHHNARDIICWSDQKGILITATCWHGIWLWEQNEKSSMESQGTLQWVFKLLRRLPLACSAHECHVKQVLAGNVSGALRSCGDLIVRSSCVALAGTRSL